MEPIKYLDEHGLDTMAEVLNFGRKKIWHGTKEQWDALADTEKQKYDQAEVLDEAEVLPGGGGEAYDDTELRGLISDEATLREQKDQEIVDAANENFTVLNEKDSSHDSAIAALQAKVEALETAIKTGSGSSGSSGSVYDSGWIVLDKTSGSKYAFLLYDTFNLVTSMYRRINNIVYIFCSVKPKNVTTNISRHTGGGTYFAPPSGTNAKDNPTLYIPNIKQNNSIGYYQPRYTLTLDYKGTIVGTLRLYNQDQNKLVCDTNVEIDFSKIYSPNVSDELYWTGSYITDDPIPEESV